MSTSKFDPSFKSKRYRDKIRTAVKELEALLPVDRSSVHRKLDSQTVFRLTIAHFRTKLFLEAAGLGFYVVNAASTGFVNNSYHCDCLSTDDSPVPVYTNNAPAISLTPGEICNDVRSIRLQQQQCAMDVVTFGEGEHSMEALGGFVLIVTSDGTILYVSNNILQHLGFNQVDLMLRCIYGIVHPDDHQELKMVLENSLIDQTASNTNQQRTCCLQNGSHEGSASCRMVSFLCRIKCFNGTTAGYLKMHCMGHMRSFPHVTKSQRTSNQVLFAFCRPFVSITADNTTSGDINTSSRNSSFWTKHELDLKIKHADDKLDQVLGYSKDQLINKSLYALIHPEDLPVVSACHRALLQNEEVQTTYFRMEHQDGRWIWLHTRCKVVTKNSKKYAISCAHCVVREEDSTYIQQEAVLRQRYSFHELATGQSSLHRDAMAPLYSSQMTSLTQPAACNNLREEQATNVSLHDPHGYCPSSWHAATDRHSPVFPISQQSSGTQHYKQFTQQYPYFSTDCYQYADSNHHISTDCSWNSALSINNQRPTVGIQTSDQMCYPVASECLKTMVSNRTDRFVTDRMRLCSQFYDQSYLQSTTSHYSYTLHSRLNGTANHSADNTVKNNNYFLANDCCFYGGNQLHRSEMSPASMPYSNFVDCYHDNCYTQLPVNAMTVHDR